MTEKKLSEARQEYVKDYTKNNYDRINVVLPNGYRDLVRARAESLGMSISEYVLMCVDNVIERGDGFNE